MTQDERNGDRQYWACRAVTASGRVTVAIGAHLGDVSSQLQVHLETPEWELGYTIDGPAALEPLIVALRTSETSDATHWTTVGTFRGGDVRVVCNYGSPGVTTIIMVGQAGEWMNWSIGKERKRELLKALEDAARDLSS